MRPKVIITQQVQHQALLDELARIDQDCEVRRWTADQAPTRDELKSWLADADGWLTAGGERIDADLLTAAPHLRVISQTQVGYDNTDIAACTARNIRVGYTPGVLVEATADLGFGLLLAAARRITCGWDMLRAGQWDQSRQATSWGVDLYGKTLGIIGMGDIGSAVARRARGFGMEIVYNNRHPRVGAETMSARYLSLSAVLAESDFLMLLTPLTEETRGLIGAKELAQMKSSAYLINMARGPIVDTDALVHALQTDTIAFAALDVTDPEPLAIDHPLMHMENVLITPHVGSATVETRTRMEQLAVDNLLAGVFGKPLIRCVNP